MMTRDRWSVFCVGVEYAKEIQIYGAVKILLARKNGGLVAPGETEHTLNSGLVRFMCREDEKGNTIGHDVDLVDHSGKPVYAPLKRTS